MKKTKHPIETRSPSIRYMSSQQEDKEQPSPTDPELTSSPTKAQSIFTDISKEEPQTLQVGQKHHNHQPHLHVDIPIPKQHVLAIKKGEDADLESNESEVALDCLQKRTGITISELITGFAWVIAIAASILYLVNSVLSYQDAVKHPVTSVSFVEQVPLQFPAVTVCNWNAAYYCDYCNLTLDYCTTVEEGTGEIIPCPFSLSFVTIEQNGQIFSCYSFNNDTEYPISVNSTGYGGSVSLYFTVPNVEYDRDARFGLQVSFHEVGSIPPVFAETNFATAFVDNFYTLTMLIVNRLRPTKEHPNTKFSQWSATYSTVELTAKNMNQVVVSFAYSTLNINAVTEIESKTVLSVIGEISGIVGVLMVCIFYDPF